MKAKVKDTGMVVNVKFTLHPNPGFERHYWFCHETGMVYDERELDFLENDNLDTKKIDWEQRRYELVKTLSASYIQTYPGVLLEDALQTILRIADKLINTLKNETSALHP